jgi:NAD(P)-dependent dehydrogenase (short-subunit alcohol dehydrogenase family)
MAEEQKIAIVTGANRGLGFETCRQLANQGVKVILTSRSADEGNAAAQSLQAQGLEVVYHPLDVTDETSVRRLADWITGQFKRLDILVNNAGIFLDTSGANGTAASVFNTDIALIRNTQETNTFGALRMMQALIPLMQKCKRGNVVNVSSGMGQLSDMNGHYPGYRISKTALNALTRIFADELKETQIKVNSVCPGWVRTDMGGPNAERSIEKGAETIVWLATLPQDGPSGGFFRDKAPIPW